MPRLTVTRVRIERPRRVAIVSVASAALLATTLFAAPASAAMSVRVGCVSGTGNAQQLVKAMRVASWRSQSALTVITLGRNCTYNLTGVGSFPQIGPTGLPIVRRHVVVHGRGAVITRAPAAPNFRIMAVGPAGNLTLHNLTISNGHAGNGSSAGNAIDADGAVGQPGQRGGGVYNNGGLLTLQNVVVSGNAAGTGGNGGSSTTSDAAAGPDNLSGPGGNGNHAGTARGGAGGSGGDGGGIYNSGKLVIIDSTISGNLAGNGGRGGDATGGRGGDGGSGTTTGGHGGDGGDTVAGPGGRGGDGGGLLNRGSLFINGSQIDGNASGDAGDSGVPTGGRGGDAGGDHGNGGTGGVATTSSGRGGTGGTILAQSGSAVLDTSTADSNSGGDASDTVPGTAGDGGVPGCEGTTQTGFIQVMGAPGGNGGIVEDGGTATLINSLVTNSTTGTSHPSGPGGSTGYTGPPCPT